MDKGKISTMQKLQKETISKPSSFAVDLPFKHQTLSRRTSIAIVQGHNIVNRHLLSTENDNF